MNGWKILKSERLLNVVNNRLIAWTFIRLFSAYKYVGFFV
jgi:hypothetical protein